MVILGEIINFDTKWFIKEHDSYIYLNLNIATHGKPQLQIFCFWKIFLMLFPLNCHLPHAPKKPLTLRWLSVKYQIESKHRSSSKDFMTRYRDTSSRQTAGNSRETTGIYFVSRSFKHSGTIRSFKGGGGGGQTRVNELRLGFNLNKYCKASQMLA